jgi:hypothetical protein
MASKPPKAKVSLAHVDGRAPECAALVNGAVMTISAYDSRAIKVLASALDDVLSDAERLRERPLGVGEKRNLTMTVTQCLLEAYDGGVCDRDDLKRFALARCMAEEPRIV